MFDVRVTGFVACVRYVVVHRCVALAVALSVVRLFFVSLECRLRTTRDASGRPTRGFVLSYERSTDCF